MFASLPYLVVVCRDGSEKQCLFKREEQVDELERISGYTAEEAKNYLLKQLEEDVTHESAMKIKEIEARFKDEAETRAREIISLAIQRCAADQVADMTSVWFPCPMTR